MIPLCAIIKSFEAEFLEQYQDSILPSHRKALSAMKDCRSSSSPQMLAKCPKVRQSGFYAAFLRAPQLPALPAP